MYFKTLTLLNSVLNVRSHVPLSLISFGNESGTRLGYPCRLPLWGPAEIAFDYY